MSLQYYLFDTFAIKKEEERNQGHRKFITITNVLKPLNEESQLASRGDEHMTRFCVSTRSADRALTLVTSNRGVVSGIGHSNCCWSHERFYKLV